MGDLTRYCSECELLQDFAARLLVRCRSGEELKSRLHNVQRVLEDFYSAEHLKTEQEIFIPWIRENYQAVNLEDFYSALKEERDSVREVAGKLQERDLKSGELKCFLEELAILLLYTAWKKSQFACNAVGLLRGELGGGEIDPQLVLWRETVMAV